VPTICAIYEIWNLASGKISWNLYGESAFVFVAVSLCPMSERVLREQERMETYDPLSLYNIATKASGGGGVTFQFTSTSAQRAEVNWRFSRSSMTRHPCVRVTRRKTRITPKQWCGKYPVPASSCSGEGGPKMGMGRRTLLLRRAPLRRNLSEIRPIKRR